MSRRPAAQPQTQVAKEAEVLKEDDESVPKPVPPLPDDELPGMTYFFNRCFEGLDAESLKKSSLAEREQSNKLGIPSLTYAEVSMPVMNQIFSLVKNECRTDLFPGGVFVDLGSGAGKACIAAALLHPFERVWGIESLGCLHKYALDAQRVFNEISLPEGRVKPQLEFVHGDFVTDFNTKVGSIAAGAMICLAVSTCYEEEHLSAMGSFAQNMPVGSIFITFTQMLPPGIVHHPEPERLLTPTQGGWILVHSCLVDAMWGVVKCFFFKRMPREGGPQEIEKPLSKTMETGIGPD